MSVRRSKRNNQLIYDEYIKHHNYAKAARELGLSASTVHRAVASINGLCSLCLKSPIVEGKTLCSLCIEKVRLRSRDRFKTLKEQGLCIQCGKVPANHGVFCIECAENNRNLAQNHRKSRREQGLCYYCNRPAINGYVCEYHYERKREYDIKGVSAQKYGGLYLDVLERDNYSCQICNTTKGSTSNKKRIEVHHVIDGFNSMDTLVTLCRRCHIAVTGLKHAPDPHAIYNWFTNNHL